MVDEQRAKSLDRLMFFSDAVVAISMTLLIVPLVESAISDKHEGQSTWDFVSDNRNGLIAFAISFAVIAALWTAHHRIFERVVDYTAALRLLNLMWLFTIAFLPLPTALVAEFPIDRVQIAIYIGTMTLSSLCLSGMVLVIRSNPSLRGAGVPPSNESLAAAITTAGLFVLAFIVAVAFPSIGYLALLLLLLANLIEPLVMRRINASVQ